MWYGAGGPAVDEGDLAGSSPLRRGRGSPAPEQKRSSPEQILDDVFQGTLLFLKRVFEEKTELKRKNDLLQIDLDRATAELKNSEVFSKFAESAKTLMEQRKQEQKELVDLKTRLREQRLDGEKSRLKRLELEAELDTPQEQLSLFFFRPASRDNETIPNEKFFPSDNVSSL